MKQSFKHFQCLKQSNFQDMDLSQSIHKQAKLQIYDKILILFKFYTIEFISQINIKLIYIQLPDQTQVQNSFIKSNLMKEAPSAQQAALTQTRSGSNTFSPGNIHQRGDKVVVNGAKESLLSILRRHVCQCGKHSLEKLTLKFLTSNRVAASYDILVWMFIFIRTNCHPTLYSTIVSEYLKKMNKKRTEDQTHRSQKYIDTKKKTLQKFIESAEILLADSIDQTKIESSVGALYSKGKSRQNAFDKIKTYMKSKNFDLDFKESKAHCNFKLKSNYSNVETFSTEKIRTSDSQDSVEQCCSETYGQKPRNPRPLQEKPTEEVSGEMQEDYANKSYRHIPIIPSYDLFDELIQNDESAVSLLSSYINFQ